MIEDIVERDRLRATHHDPDLHVILQVVADAGGVEHDVDAVALQQLCGADAGKLQQLRAVIGAARDQDFLSRPRGSQSPVLPVLDTGGGAVRRTGCAAPARSLDMQVLRPRAGRRYAIARARPPAIPRRGRNQPAAFLRRTVEVGIVGYAGSTAP